MKTLKSIAAVSLLAASTAGLASAYTPAAGTDHLYVAGAPAYRAESIATLDYIVKTVYAANGGGEIASSISAASAASGNNYSNTNQVIWVIPNYEGGHDLEISASFTGSTSGVESVLSTTQSFPQKFIPDTNTGVIGTAIGVGSSGNTEVHQPDISLSDTFPATTPFNGTQTLETPNDGDANSYSFASASPTKLGVEAYQWVGSSTLAGKISNITTSQAQLLYKNGKLPLSFFTGNSADATSFVYPLTRDPGSGARLIAVAESGVGVTTFIKTYKPAVTGGSADSQGNIVGGTISSGTVPLYPAGQIASTQIWDDFAGDTGYPKFGTTDTSGLLAAITAAAPTGEYFITYLDNADATEATTVDASGANHTPAIPLTYNGNSPTDANVEEGKYTFWSYEQLYKSPTIGTVQSGFAATIVANFPTFADLPVSALHVSRTVDGGAVTHN